MVRHETSSADAAAPAGPADIRSFSSIACASYILEDWMTWAQIACGRLTATDQVSRSALIWPPFRILPHPGCAFSEDGDDGSVSHSIDLLRARVAWIAEVVNHWQQYWIVGNVAMTGQLFHWMGPIPARGLTMPVVAQSAHHFVVESLRGFVDHFAVHRSNLETLNAVHWDANTAARALVGMARERTLVELNAAENSERRHLEPPGAEAVSRDAEPEDTTSLLEGVRSDRFMVEMLRSVARRPGILRKQLAAELTEGKKPNGFFNSKIALLRKARLIESGAGRASTGYLLTCEGLSLLSSLGPASNSN
jgi:hypothetical protein